MCQFHAKSEIQTLRTESDMDFNSDSGSLGLYLQHIFKNQPWLLRESLKLTCASLGGAVR